jgi:V8-like Glu-specific endopeptidase
MPIVVEILGGSRRGHRVVLEKPVVTLGRHPDNDIVFDPVAEPLVSAFHAEIREIGPGRYVLVDRGSSNGTWVEGERITELAFDGRLEIGLAQNGPRLALMPLMVVPAQAADVLTTPGTLQRPVVSPGIDPLVVAPTADGPVSAFRGPGRIGRATEGDVSPPGGAVLPAGAAPPPPMPDVPTWQRPPLGPQLAGLGITSEERRRLGVTAQIRAVAGDMVRRTSRRFWVAVVVLAVLLAGAGVFLALMLSGTIRLGEAGNRTAEHPGPTVVQAADALTEVAGAAAALPAPKEIVERNRNAIFLLGAELLGKSEGFCTGFALTPRILATNAHCVLEMQKIWAALGDGQGVFAYQNEHPGVKFRIRFALMDPGYKEDETDAIYPDIGLAVIEGHTDQQVRLAPKAQAAKLRVGDRVYLLGFPGALNSTESPVATLTEGIVSRLTDLGQRKASPEQAVLIQHSAFTTKGTSGSPLLDENGEVIGINTGYYRGESEQQRLDPVTGRVRDEMVTQDLQNYAIGMRVDLVHDLLQLLYERIPGTQESAGVPEGSATGE